MYEVFEHTADLGLRVRSATLEELLGEAARGFVSLIVADPKAIQPRVRRAVRVEAAEPEYLLLDWLNELLYLFDTQHFLGSEFQIALGAAGLTAEIVGETLDPARHLLEHEVKAITYHALTVERQADGWLAEVIVDI